MAAVRPYKVVNSIAKHTFPKVVLLDNISHGVR